MLVPSLERKGPVPSRDNETGSPKGLPEFELLGRDVLAKLKPVKVGDSPDQVTLVPSITRCYLIAAEYPFQGIRLILPRHVIGTCDVWFEPNPGPKGDLGSIEFALLVGFGPRAFFAILPIGVLHEAGVRGSIRPAARRKASTAQGRLAHTQDILIVAFCNTIGDRDPRLRRFVEHLELLGSSLKLTSIVAEDPLDLTTAAEVLESSPGFLVAFVLHGD